MTSLDNLTDEIFKDEPPAAKAIQSLIEVKDKVKGKDSEIELKTDITEVEQKTQAVLSVVAAILTEPELMQDQCVLTPVIDKLQRLALSKDRKSRSEIVMVARQPELNMLSPNMQPDGGFFSNLFRSRKTN